MRKLMILAAVFASGCGPIIINSGGGTTTSRTITNGDQLVSAMRNRYAGRWYQSLTFVQKSTYYRPDGSILRTETWYEAAQLPGRLRIDMGEPSRGTGALYRGDTLYQVQGGRITARREQRNPLLILGFDVYAQSSAETAHQLRREGIDLSMLRTDTLDGRRMYVVGAAKNDSTANQFWVDADRMLFVRLIQNTNGRVADIRFGRYTQYGNGWVAEDVRIFSGGRMTFHEEYSQVRVDDPLDSNLFVPERWSSAQHWYRP